MFRVGIGGEHLEDAHKQDKASCMHNGSAALWAAVCQVAERSYSRLCGFALRGTNQKADQGWNCTRAAHRLLVAGAIVSQHLSWQTSKV